MVVFDNGDSQNLIAAAEADLKEAKQILTNLVKGAAHLSEVINSGTLSGAAYTAGQEMFETYIVPMIQKLSQAVEDIESDLKAYKSASQAASSVNSHLDSEIIKNLIKNAQDMIDIVEQQIKDDENYIRDFAEGGFSKIASALGELPGFRQDLENLKLVKAMHEKELLALETFVSSTSSLFTDSEQALKYAMQGVDVINQSRASVDGTITFPAGANMSWAKELSNVKFDSKLSSTMDTKELESLYPQYKNNPKAMQAMANFLEALSQGKTGKDLKPLYDKLVGYTKNQKDLDKLNDTVKELQMAYPDTKLTICDKRPKVMPDDKISTVTVTYNYEGTKQGATFVINETTNQTLKDYNNNGVFGGMTDYYENGSFGDTITGIFLDRIRAQTDPDYSGMGTAASDADEISSSVSTEKQTSTGKQYLDQVKADQENEKKKAEEEAEREKKDSELKTVQNLSHNGGASGTGTGEDMGGGRP